MSRVYTVDFENCLKCFHVINNFRQYGKHVSTVKEKYIIS